MTFTGKDWKDSPDTSTPLSAAALEDMETRLSAYTDTVAAAGIELGYAEITSNATFTTVQDIAGLTTTVTVGTRPIMIEFYGVVFASVADKYIIGSINEGATQISAGASTPGVTSAFSTLMIRTRIAPSAGPHTYKIRALCQSGTGTIGAAATQPAYISVVEV